MTQTMILTMTRETRTGARLVQVSLARIDLLLDEPRYSLPQETPAPPVVRKPGPEEGRRWR